MSKKTHPEQVSEWLKNNKDPAKPSQIHAALEGTGMSMSSVYQSVSKLTKAGVIDRIGKGQAVEYVYADPQPGAVTKSLASVEAPEAPKETPEPAAEMEEIGPDKNKEELIWNIQTTITKEAEEAREMEQALTAKGARLGRLISMLEEAKGL